MYLFYFDSPEFLLVSVVEDYSNPFYRNVLISYGLSVNPTVNSLPLGSNIALSIMMWM